MILNGVDERRKILLVAVAAQGVLPQGVNGQQDNIFHISPFNI
jgi:hypothetical protein